MSSILKALKKLENETSQKVRTPSWPRHISTGEVLNRRARTFQLVRRVAIATGLFAVIGAGGFVFSQHPAWFSRFLPASETHPPMATVEAPKPATVSPAPAPPPVQKPVIASDSVRRPSAQASAVAVPAPSAPARNAQQAAKTAPVASVNRGGRRPPVIPSAKRPPQKVQKPATLSENGNRSATAESVSKRTAAPVAEKTARRVAPKRAVSTPVTPVKKPENRAVASAPARKRRAPAARPEKKAATPVNVRAAEADLTGENPAILRAHRSLPEKSGAESGFEIQALVWSPDPESRMAVINGNIVRTGGIVDDASVQYIGTDYIVFRKGSARWRTRFQLN